MLQTDQIRAGTLRVRGALRAGVLLLVAASVMGGTGCVQRRLTIRSNPPGALVYVGDDEIGTTPVSTPFVYYGVREIRLIKSGYETLTVQQPIPTPWYEYPGLDFVSENLIPGEIRDERVVDFQLKPLMIKPSPQLLAEGENLRRSVPPPATVLPGPPGVMPGPPGTVTGPPMFGPGPQELPPGQPVFPGPPAGQLPPPNNPFGPPSGQFGPPPGQFAPPPGQFAPPGGQFTPPGVQPAPMGEPFGQPPVFGPGPMQTPPPTIQPGPPVSPPPTNRPGSLFNY